MIRIILLLFLGYLIYNFYKRSQNPQEDPGIKDSGKVKVFPKSSCPSPKTFINYTEGRIDGKKKKAIDSHIAHCKDCQDALKDVFGMSPQEKLKK